MEFADKLNYLFELTRAEGKELAAALRITPPGVSKMRKGLRGLPRNREAAWAIALFFARRCQGKEQRDALAKVMRVAQVASVDEDEVLADMLLAWFLNEKLRDRPVERDASAFLHRLNISAGSRVAAPTGAAQPPHSAGNNIFAYYGVEGKRAALMVFWRYLLERKEAFDVGVLSDEDNTWIDDDPSYASGYYDLLLRLTEQGCFFRRIVGPLNTVSQAFYSLNRWYPLYLTGKAVSFYYKRMRDDVNRITILVAPGVATLYSFSVGATLDRDCVTFFTTDTRTVGAMAALFKRYLALCDPATKTYNADSDETLMHERMLEYESFGGACMQLNTSLSFITLPWEIAIALRTDRDLNAKDAFLASFAKRHKVFQKNLEQFDFFDFIRLADISDIMDGAVPIPAASILSSDAQYYTPAGYLQHLRSVEYLLKRRSHYHVIIEPADADEEPVIYVKEDSSVIITRAATPFVIFDVSERNLIDAFTENVRRRIPERVHEAEYRKETLRAIHALIQQLEERLDAPPGGA